MASPTKEDRERASHVYQMSHRMLSGSVVEEQIARQLAHYREEDSKPRKTTSTFTTNPTTSDEPEHE